MLDNFWLLKTFRPTTGNCYGYHIVIRFEKPIFYRGKERTETHYFGSCSSDRLQERLEEQLTPQIQGDRYAYTLRIRDGEEYEYKQSSWIYKAIHNYDGKPELVETVELPTDQLHEAAKIWDKRQSDYYESLGMIAYGK